MFHEKNAVVLAFPAPSDVTDAIPTIRRGRSRLFWLLPVSLALVMATFLLILTVRAGAAWLPSEDADAFAPYRAVMPGQPGAMTDQFPCQRYDVPDMEQTFACVLAPADSAFRKVDMHVADGEIYSVTFYPRNMRAVELVWRWGYPDKIGKLGDKYIIEWNQLVSAMTESRPHFSLQAAVSLIMVTKADD